MLLFFIYVCIPKNIPNDKPHLIAVIVKGNRKTYFAFK